MENMLKIQGVPLSELAERHMAPRYISMIRTVSRNRWRLTEAA